MAASQSQNYAFEEVGDGIHAAIARLSGNAICNSGLIDIGEAALIFDTSLTPTTARELRYTAEQMLGRLPSLAAISHWHLDHSLGNQEFSSVPIWATRRTREILVEMHDRLTAELTRERLEKDLREMEGLRGTMPSEDARNDLQLNLQINRAILSEIGRLKLTPPDHTFETRLSLPGRRGAELISFGAAHTEADAVLFLPHEKVVFAGDLVVVGLQPSMGSGNPDHWLVVLDQVERLGAERIVPGHGPVVATDGMQEVRGYLSGVLEAAESPEGAPLPSTVRRWEGSVSLKENLKFARGWVASRHGRK
ncbi:MAG: MBL fold metallo-hydrolase [Thermoplasmata archaeon]|jgi:glyoxylase-like metal-dependent hydrolase (beta-lactamase superfamily II)